MLLRKLGALATTAVAFLGIGMVNSSSASAEVTTHLINANWDPTMCATTYGGSHNNGAFVTQWGCSGDVNQTWVWSGGRIIQQASGKCLTPYGGHLTDETQLVIWDCNGSTSQQWENCSSATCIKNVASGKAITSYGGSAAAGADLVQFSFNDNISQWWSIV